MSISLSLKNKEMSTLAPCGEEAARLGGLLSEQRLQVETTLEQSAHASRHLRWSVRECSRLKSLMPVVRSCQQGPGKAHGERRVHTGLAGGSAPGLSPSDDYQPTTTSCKRSLTLHPVSERRVHIGPPLTWVPHVMDGAQQDHSQHLQIKQAASGTHMSMRHFNEAPKASCQGLPTGHQASLVESAMRVERANM